MYLAIFVHSWNESHLLILPLLLRFRKHWLSCRSVSVFSDELKNVVAGQIEFLMA
jgi:hypothetical protein